jgi:predicted O-linked N-acetylglucosamine transferase (SPINDLY family)
MNDMSSDFEPAGHARDPAIDALHAGLDLHAQGRYAEAIESFARALSFEPGMVAPYVNAAACFAALGAFPEAMEWTSVALELDPDNAANRSNLGNLLEVQGRTDEAIGAWLKALEIDPSFSEAYNNLAVVLARQGDRENAVALFRRAAESGVVRASLFVNFGQTLLEMDRIEDAQEAFARALASDPDDLPATEGLARCAVANEDFARAEALLEAAAASRPDSTELLALLGFVQLKLRNLEKATEAFARLIELDPTDASAYRNLGLIAQDLSRFDMAETNLLKAIELDPASAETRYDFVSMLLRRQFFPAALEAADEALAQVPHHAPLLRLKVEALRRLGRYRDALPICERVLELMPDDVEILTEKGVLLDGAGREAEACEAFDRAIAIGGETPLLVNLKGLAKRESGAIAEAVECFRRTLELEPLAHGVRLNLGVTLGDMHRFEQSEAEFARLLRETRDVRFLSSYLMSLHYNPHRTREEIFDAHVRWAALYRPEGPSKRPAPRRRAPGEKLRVGFISAGFHQHPVGAMITKGLENLPSDIACYFYSNDAAVDAITHRLRAVAAEWRPVHGLSDDAVERLIREDELDVLVDLSGHSAGNRLGVIAREPAPVIVKWVGGLFNTSGMDAFDYLISDAVETPEEHDRFYTERVVRLPDDYICYLPPHYCPDVGTLPALANGFVTFGCFNNPTKVNPVVVTEWAKILAAVPNSRLLLKHKQYAFEEFNRPIREIARAHGIADDRLIFEGAAPHDQLLAAYGRVDIALDPWPYSGGLTTCEALWMGVPVVSLPGPTFAGRHSATHLVNSGFADCVVEDWEGYRGKAAELASDLDALARLRAGLRDRVASSPLCDGPRFGFNLGEAFHRIAVVDDETVAARARRAGLPAQLERRRVVDAIGRGLPAVLEYSGEFGAEITGFLPYMHWLSDVGLLKDRKVRTYAGMACFYRGLNCGGIEEKSEPRDFVHPDAFPDWMSVKDTHTFDRTYADSPFHRYPDMRAMFAGVELFPEVERSGKPILVIHNKYCDEWNRGPINFIPCNVLEEMLTRFEREYSVVYIRHGMAGEAAGYSGDHNTGLDYDDRSVLERHPDCLVFDDLFAAYRAEGGRRTVNEMKGAIYARCRHFISVQGGGAQQMAYYDGSIVAVLHRAGHEERWAYEGGYFRFAANPAPRLLVTRTSEGLLDLLDAFSRPTVLSGRAVVPLEAEAIFTRFAPDMLRRG